ncbi:hypothetical protein ACFLX0_02165 [Chloroflexota bacterium]
MCYYDYALNGMRTPDGSLATDLDIGSTYNLSNIDVSGLAISGNTTAVRLLAGTANGTQVYRSNDSGSNWTRSRKRPTGQSQTQLLLAPDFTSSQVAYSATSGTESAFSYTTDGGVTWNQVGLIDTKISDNGIIDLAVSSNYSQDNSLFILTFDGEHTEHSLWRSLNGGAKWERTLTDTLAGVDSINRVKLSPQYGNGSQVVFLARNSGSNSIIWKSTNNGQTFTPRSAPFSIDIWEAVNDDTLFLGSYNGSNGLVYRTTDSGCSYSSGAAAGSQSLKSMALSANYEQDKTILIGNSNGWVFWSEDNGTSFKLLGQQLPLSSTSWGTVTVACDPEFDSNKTVYAASAVTTTSASKKRIYRFIIGKSDTWESIDSTLPVGSILSRLAVSDNGTLYATNSQSTDTTEQEGGMERSLNTTYPLNPTFETVTRGLDDDVTLTELWLQGNQLWSIDSKNTKLVTYIDSLSQPATLTSPLDKAPGVGTANVRLDWETLKGATSYEWQLDYDTDFSTVPSGFEGTTTESATQSPALGTATSYYWRVRATEPVLSLWSAKWSFATGLGTTVTAPELFSPKAGASEVPLRPVFQWGDLAGADSYELLLSTNFAFSNPTILKMGDFALPSTAWQSNINLDYDTTYYWKVRASSANSYSAWSAVGAFTTESAPSEATPAPELPSQPAPTLSPSPSPAPPPAPAPPLPPSTPQAQSTIPDWSIYLIGALLLTTVILLITLLLMVAGIRRS